MADEGEVSFEGRTLSFAGCSGKPPMMREAMGLLEEVVCDQFESTKHHCARQLLICFKIVFPQRQGASKSMIILLVASNYLQMMRRGYDWVSAKVLVTGPMSMHNYR